LVYGGMTMGSRTPESHRRRSPPTDGQRRVSSFSNSATIASALPGARTGEWTWPQEKVERTAPPN